MGTVVLLNIDGRLVNVANVTYVEWYGGYIGSKPEFSYPQALKLFFIGEEGSTTFEDSPASRAAYEWLKSLAVDPVLAMGHIEPEKS